MLLLGLGSGVVLLGVFLLLRYDPVDAAFFPKCVLHSWTGLHCPGCGATRAMHALVHGRPLEAVRFNPLLVVGGPIIAMGIWLQHRRQRKGLPTSALFSKTVAIIVLSYFAARNLPTPQTSWLAPQPTQSADP